MKKYNYNLNVLMFIIIMGFININVLFADNTPFSSTIIHTPISHCPLFRWPAQVNATVSSVQGVDSVWVKWYKSGSDPSIKRFNLINSSGNNWSETFNSTQQEVSINTQISYRIFVRDNSAFHIVDSTQLYQFYITQYVLIGTGNVSSAFPFTTYFMDGRTQYLYYANELLIPNNTRILSLSFNVEDAISSPLNDFTIKIRPTYLNTLTGFNDSAGWTTVYSGTYTVPGTGWQQFVFQSLFYYTSGTNLLVDICYNNSTFTGNSTIYATATTGDFFGRRDDLPTQSGCNNSNWSTTVSPPGKANIRFYPEIITNIEPSEILPVEYVLYQNYPNPFNPFTKIGYLIPKAGYVRLSIYNILGEEIAVPINEFKPAGKYLVNFNGSGFSSGIYFYKLSVNGFNDLKKFILLK